MLWPCP